MFHLTIVILCFEIQYTNIGKMLLEMKYNKDYGRYIKTKRQVLN